MNDLSGLPHRNWQPNYVDDKLDDDLDEAQSELAAAQARLINAQARILELQIAEKTVSTASQSAVINLGERGVITLVGDDATIRYAVEALTGYPSGPLNETPFSPADREIIEFEIRQLEARTLRMRAATIDGVFAGCEDARP